jgi:hypothetical protein
LLIFLKEGGELGMVVHAYNSNIKEAEAERSCILHQPGLHSEFYASLGYIGTACLKTKQNK